MQEYLLCLIPLFVAVDPFALLPIYLGMSGSLNQPQRRRMVLITIVAAVVMGLGFFAAGRPVLRFLGVEIADFRIAGGVLLLIIAVKEIFAPKGSFIVDTAGGSDPALAGLVPLATPLIIGPAVLTAGLALVDLYGLPTTSLALLTVLAIVAAAFTFGRLIIKFIPMGMLSALSKIIHILLAGIAISFIRLGIREIIAQWGVLAE